MVKQNFGGDWTQKKLITLDKYIHAYVKVLKNTGFLTVYIDAFAGTGYREVDPSQEGGLFENNLVTDEPGVKEYIDGSAKIALNVQPCFDEYHFVEKNRNKFKELKKLGDAHPDKKIVFCNDDANLYIQDICRPGNSRFWVRHRGVIFLDPFGMNLEWKTLEAIASTHSIDVWILFPLAQGVSRLLHRDGNIPKDRQDKLTSLFGTDAWKVEFYKQTQLATLFDTLNDRLKKDADFNKTTDFITARLKTIFPYVMEKPYQLFNSKNIPLYLFCFAAGNAGEGGRIAVKIARDITKE